MHAHSHGVGSWFKGYQDATVANLEYVTFGIAFDRPAPVHRVEFHQVGMAAGIALDLVDVDDLQLFETPAGPQPQLAHATESVDAYADAHTISPLETKN